MCDRPSTSSETCTTQAEEDHEKDEATTGDQERDGIAEGQQNAPPRQKPRISKITKWLDDKEVVTELTPKGFPKETKAKLRMKKLAGLIARQIKGYTC